MKIMKCGHAPNAIDGEGNPACVICFGSIEAKTIIEIELELGRKAQCSICDKVVDSREHLPFFRYRGKASYEALHKCKCGYYDVAHGREGSMCKCDKFVAHGEYEYDEYYCGCRGWD